MAVTVRPSSLFVFPLLIVLACTHAQKTVPEVSDTMAARSLEKLSEDYWDLQMQENPIWATYLTDRRFDDQLPDLSPEGRRKAVSRARFLLGETRAIDPKTLHEQDRVTREMLMLLLEGPVQTEVCQAHLWDVNALNGVQTQLGELPSLHPILTPAHAESLVRRFEKSGPWLDQHISNLRVGQEQGYSAAKVAVVRVIAQLESMFATPPAQSPLVTSVVLPADWDEARKKEVRDALTRAVAESVYPGLQRYHLFLKNEYLPQAREAVGVSANRDGAACYRARILAETHLPLTAEEIHAVGKAQAEQNVADMKAIALRMTGKEDLESVKKHLDSKPENHVDSREALMDATRAWIAKAERKVPEVIGRLPKTRVEVKSIETFREQAAPTGYYYSGSSEEQRPAYFYLNTYQPEKRILPLLESLTMHEAVPGHHVQIALAQELEGLPRFRRELGDGAFIEGWAHYAELLADELGLYSGDAGRFGMLSDQSMRAVRLVVDTGMHALGWTREQALQYMLTHTAEPRGDAEREIDRYIVWPGQALTYKLGQLEILRLRKEAMERLGDRFDVRAFHDALLARGAIPLPVLRRVMTDWIAAEAAKGGDAASPK